MLLLVPCCAAFVRAARCIGGGESELPEQVLGHGLVHDDVEKCQRLRRSAFRL